jgi:hypothetical protein
MSTKTTVSRRPRSKPPRELRDAACRGDVTAILAVADWYRERNYTPPPGRAGTERADADFPPSFEELASGMADADIAVCSEALAFDVQVLTTQAMQVRTLLPKLRRPAPAGRYSHSAMCDYFASVGLPVEVYEGYWSSEAGTRRGVTIVVVPPDGEDRDPTEGLLLDFCAALYPQRSFGVEFDNTPITVAGRIANSLL